MTKTVTKDSTLTTIVEEEATSLTGEASNDNRLQNRNSVNESSRSMNERLIVIENALPVIADSITKMTQYFENSGLRQHASDRVYSNIQNVVSMVNHKSAKAYGLFHEWPSQKRPSPGP